MSKAEDARPRLGRGLAALLGTSEEATAGPVPSHRQRRVPLEHLRPNPQNPRKTFGEAELAELADSIRARGVLQPIVVRALPSGHEYEIVAGERRWRAAQRAAVHDVPVVIVQADDKLALELAIIENVQRADLNPADEARGYRNLMDSYGYTQADLGAAIGKSRSHVANTLRLLKLPEGVLDMLASGALSAGHARALLAVPDPQSTADAVVRDGLSVRAVERLAAGDADEPGPTKPKETRLAPPPDANTRALASALTRQTGLKVEIERKGERGRIIIDFKSIEQFDYVYKKLNEL